MAKQAINTKALLKAIKARGWSCSEAARQAKMSISHLNEIVNGHVPAPYRRTIEHLARVLGVDVTALVLNPPKGGNHRVACECTPWAVNMARQGATLWQLMARGGWTSPQTVMRYINIARAGQ